MDINDVKFSVNRFEKMINENSLLFFDSFEFENIINYYLENGKTEYARKAIELSLSQHPTSSNLILLESLRFGPRLGTIVFVLSTTD